MHGHVTILGYTPNIEAAIASGGRISTMDGTADEIFEKSLAAGKEKNEKLIGKVLSSGHTSVLEHGFLNLAFENVSVLAEQFLIEFRLASFTVKSRRYVDFSKAGYVSPAFETQKQREIFDEAVTGMFLAVYYAPTPDHAYDSVQFIAPAHLRPAPPESGERDVAASDPAEQPDLFRASASATWCSARTTRSSSPT